MEHFLHLQQEDQLANMENRNYFSLHCLQMETQLVHTHLEIFHEFVLCMASVEKTTNSDVSSHDVNTRVVYFNSLLYCAQKLIQQSS